MAYNARNRLIHPPHHRSACPFRICHTMKTGGTYASFFLFSHMEWVPPSIYPFPACRIRVCRTIGSGRRLEVLLK